MVRTVRATPPATRPPAAGPVTTSRIHPGLRDALTRIPPDRIVRVAEHGGYVVDVLVRNAPAQSKGPAPR